MNLKTERPEGKSVDDYRKAAGPLAPYAFIWGIQSVVRACLQYIWIWPYAEWIFPATAIPALLVSLYVWVKQTRRPPDPEGAGLPFSSVRLILLFAAAAGSILLLRMINAVDPLFIPVIAALALSTCYFALGKWLGKPLTYLGLWLCALTAVISLRYLGYASAVLGSFGGLSLIALGWMIGRWRRSLGPSR
mgnify:CR=1 FL=1